MFRSIPILCCLGLGLTGCYTLSDSLPPYTGPSGATGSDTGTSVASADPSTGTGTTETEPGGSDTGSARTASDTTPMDTPSATDGTDHSDGPEGDAGTGEVRPTSCEEGIQCYNPPKECDETDNTRFKKFEPVGTCGQTESGPMCQYASLGTEKCTSGICVDGQCVDHPCQNVSCDYQAAPSRCQDSDTLQYWWGVGTGECVVQNGQAECDYQLMSLDCPYGCEPATDTAPAMCPGQSCANVVCALKPASYCDKNGILRVFDVGAGIVDEDGICHCVFDSISPLQCPSGHCDPALGRCVGSEK